MASPRRSLPTLALVALVLLAGCSGFQTDTRSAPGETPAPTQTATAASSSEPSATPATDGYRVTVVSVVDGDTMEVRYRNGTRDTVRLLGVDTPEVHGGVTPDEFEGVPDTAAGRACLEDAADRASAYATEELAGDTVRIAVDPQADRRGSYGRLLVYLSDDGQQFNYQLVAQGYARVYDSSFGQRDRFDAAEMDARTAQRGLWACQRATATASRTAGADGRLRIATVHADAAGNDHENLNDEYVVFENDGSEPLDLSAWVVRDAAGHAYTVPDGVALAPGARITLYTGSGSDSSTALYWGAESAVWNNAGDTITVLNERGAVVREHTYG